MKKVLTLLSVFIIGSEFTSNVVFCSNINSETKLNIFENNTLTDSELNDTKDVAIANILHSTNNLDANDILTQEAPDSSELNNIFGVSDDISKMISSDSEIPYQVDNSNSLKRNDIFPNASKITQYTSLISSILPMFDDPNKLITLLESYVNISQILGSLFGEIIDNNTSLFNISTITNLPNLINKINSTYNGKTYQNVLTTQMSNFENILSDYNSSNPINLPQDKEVIIQTLLIIINYISQYNFSLSSSDGSHLYSDSKTNSQIMEEVYSKKFDSNINFSNIKNLISNIANINTNNGLFIRQLLYPIFGINQEGITKLKSDISNMSGRGDNGWFASDYAEMPDYGYEWINYNPIGKTLNDYTNKILNDKISSSLSGIESAAIGYVESDLDNQFPSIIDNLFYAIIENRPLNLFVDDSQILIHNIEESDVLGISIYNKIENSYPQLGTLFTDITNFTETIKSNNRWFDTNDSTDPLNDRKCEYDKVLNNYSHTFDDLWNGDDVNNLTNVLLKFIKNLNISINININISSNINNLQTTFKNLLDKKISSNSPISIENILQQISDGNNSLLSILSNNSNSLNELITNFLSSLTNNDVVNQANKIFTKDVDVSKIPSGEYDFVTNAQKNKSDNALVYIAALSIAEENEYLKNNITIDDVNNDLFKMLGFDLSNGSNTTGSIAQYITNNWTNIESLLNSISQNIQNLVTTNENNYFDKYYNSSNWIMSKPVFINNKYQYTLTNNNIIYNISIIKNNNNDYWKISISK